ncbi:VOC family protein [Nocardia caishijiensis]|uniref:Glyoxalase superfamily protein PhnB n=1 Tax=Nocardia caishijiensis TaxID=184756 RepID=A0ABQ6YMK2_9NOCA|nr:VOC family protein [Nocardia caishijiensis]KAF0847018.1 putative glyoxalase superfamily protein PhnB [Nocardia caishijiensis]
MSDGFHIGAGVELHVPNFDEVRTFYQKLGFEFLWSRAPEGKKGYLVASLGSNVLCFWGGNESIYSQSYFGQFEPTTPRGYGVEIVIMVEDLDLYHSKAAGTGRMVDAVRDRPWGVRDFRVADPFGYYLRFTEPLDIRDRRYSVE